MTDITKIETPPKISTLIYKVNEIIDDKQDLLISGTNIKTINNQSILGNGNLEIGQKAVWSYSLVNEELEISNTSKEWIYSNEILTLEYGYNNEILTIG